jgi:hypothetical protein
VGIASRTYRFTEGGHDVDAYRREAAIALVTAILLRWGLHVVARQVATEIVNRLDKAGVLKED